MTFMVCFFSPYKSRGPFTWMRLWANSLISIIGSSTAPIVNNIMRYWLVCCSRDNDVNRRREHNEWSTTHGGILKHGQRHEGVSLWTLCLAEDTPSPNKFFTDVAASLLNGLVHWVRTQMFEIFSNHTSRIKRCCLKHNQNKQVSRISTDREVVNKQILIDFFLSFQRTVRPIYWVSVHFRGKSFVVN